ncbi:MAG: hypothetical protein AABZ74_18840 [Cyanobacteriota bacterium]
MCKDLISTKKLPKIKLIPVIEVEPFSYSKSEHKTPEKPRNEDPNEWEIYNQNCYKDSGLENFKPIEIGHWLFEIEKLRNHNLKIILSKIFEEKLDEDFTLEQMLEDIYDFSPLISGGYVFSIDNENLNLPGCCCGLETIYDWANIFDEESGDIWNGHDSNIIEFKKEGQNLIINIDKKDYSLKLKEFNKIFESLEKTIDEFIERCSGILNEILKIENGYDLAKSMIYKY